jgi:hypothetical protein
MSILSLPRPRRRFYHHHFIDSDLNPSLCEVTRVDGGMVYYALVERPHDRKVLPHPAKADMKARTDFFLQQALGYWEDEALPHSERARGLRHWAAANAIREVFPLADRARLVAEYLHAADGNYPGDRDKADAPYMNHVQSVVDGVEGEDEKVVAYLHDTKEDHGLADIDFEWLGFSPEHILAINNLSKLPGERGKDGYHDFIVRAARHPLSRAVKLADLRDNAREERIPLAKRTEHDSSRTEKYRREIAFLESLPALSAVPEIF